MKARADQETGNGWDHKGHWCFTDRGRENDDGAITEQVYKPIHPAGFRAEVPVKRAGGLRIEPDGFITRWPCADPGMKAAIKRVNAAVKAGRNARREEIKEFWLSEGYSPEQAARIAKQTIL